MDDMKSSIKELKSLDILENAVQDAEKKNKNDNDFNNLTADFTLSMKKIEKASDLLDYHISDETCQLAEDSINKIEEVISSGAVDEEALFNAKTQVNRKLNSNLKKEWSEFYQKKVSGARGRLAIIRGLVKDQNKLTRISDDIGNASDWDGLSISENGTTTRLELLKYGIDDIDHIAKDLNLSDEITNFILLVSSGKANVANLNENILQWIKNENLSDMFFIKF